MRTTTELEQEIDRIYEIKENANFVIKSLYDKVKYLNELFETEDCEVKKAYEIGYREKNILESNVIRFLDGESCVVDFEINEEVEKNNV
jgi:hypothetical protein